MSVEALEITLPEALEAARADAVAQGLNYAGGVRPAVAWALVQSGQAVLVDVRSTEERKFVGHVPGSQHVAWATGTALTRNPRFVRELEAKLAKDGGKDAVVLLLCRSGVRSVAAAQRATELGLQAYSILEGFEGDLDANGQRGKLNGWRYRGLPWQQ